jgi:3-oxoacyl-[acyl-carrier protein] reductase
MSSTTNLSRSIAGRIAIVTGAASGMGRATAELFAREGARVAVVDIDGERAAEVASRLEADGRVAVAWRLDVGEARLHGAFVDEVGERLGPVDILVNNAGVPAGGAFDAPDAEAQWERSMRVNLMAQVNLTRACLPDLTREPGGRIVNIASTAALGGSRFVSPYSTAKHGVVGLTRALAVELADRGVTVNCVCPGAIRTPMTAHISDEHKERYARRRVPARRYGEPEEVAHAILSLVLPAASYINGVVLPVDGGLTIKND